jgi:predicted nucleic acid-binding protein
VLAANQFTIVDSPPPPPELLSWDLGSGETAVLSLAISERNWVVIFDDAAARKCARSFSVPVKGTLAIVLLAKQQGLIVSAAQVIQALIDVGFRIDNRTIKQVLAHIAGEQWPS